MRSFRWRLFQLCRRVVSISLICSWTNRRRAMSRRISARVLGGNGVSFGVRSALETFRRALRKVGLKLRMPKRIRHAFMRLTMRVRCLPGFHVRDSGAWRPPLRASESPTCCSDAGSPRSQPRNTRFNSSVSRRSVLARRCSRETATLDWMDDIGLDAARPKPARQPKSITASLEGNDDAFDLACPA